MLVVAEANRRNIGPEVLVRTEVSEKAHRPNDAEVAKFYAENRKDIRGELNVVQNQLADFLEERDKQRLQRDLYERLRRASTCASCSKSHRRRRYPSASMTIPVAAIRKHLSLSWSLLTFNVPPARQCIRLWRSVGELWRQGEVRGARLPASDSRKRTQSSRSGKRSAPAGKVF